MEEELREAVATGNEVRVGEILLNCDAAVLNSKNSVNGWTALHWACKRNYTSIAEKLIKHGADVSLRNNKGEVAADLTTSDAMLSLIGVQSSRKAEEVSYLKEEKPPIIPSYLANPVFPYTSSNAASAQSRTLPGLDQPEFRRSSFGVAVPPQDRSSTQNSFRSSLMPQCNEIVFKIRIADDDDTDYYEIDFPTDGGQTYELLLTTMCHELNVDRSHVKKIRKIPNTVVRRDRDVGRLRNGEELELVLHN